MGHEQLQELVAAGAQRPDLRDGVRIPEHGTQAVMPPSTLLSMSRSAEPMPRWGRAFCFSELAMLLTITPTIRPVLLRASPVRGSAS